jgi:hypothetical protein
VQAHHSRNHRLHDGYLHQLRTRPSTTGGQGAVRIISNNRYLSYEYSLLSLAKANPHTNIVIFWDGMASDARYDVFSPNGNIRVPQGELNTGDPTTLRNFVNWAVQNYPATHYALIISDHGHGINGAAIDYNIPDYVAAEDSVTATELQQALSPPIPKLDIVYMNACLMGTIDVAFQLRDLTNYYVASESVSWGPIHPDWFILGNSGYGILPITDSTSAQDLALAIVESYISTCKSAASEYPSTISAVNVGNVNDVAAKASALAGLLRSKMSSVRSTLDHVWADVQRYNERGCPEITTTDRLADLYDFASLVQTHVSDQGIQDAAGDLMAAINDYVLPGGEDHWSGAYEHNGQRYTWSHEHSHGVSVFLPPADQRECYYNGDWLDFAAGTNWHCQGGGMHAASASDASIEWAYVSGVHRADKPIGPCEL